MAFAFLEAPLAHEPRLVRLREPRSMLRGIVVYDGMCIVHLLLSHLHHHKPPRWHVHGHPALPLPGRLDAHVGLCGEEGNRFAERRHGEGLGIDDQVGSGRGPGGIEDGKEHFAVSWTVSLDQQIRTAASGVRHRLPTGEIHRLQRARVWRDPLVRAAGMTSSAHEHDTRRRKHPVDPEFPHVRLIRGTHVACRLNLQERHRLPACDRPQEPKSALTPGHRRPLDADRVEGQNVPHLRGAHSRAAIDEVNLAVAMQEFAHPPAELILARHSADARARRQWRVRVAQVLGMIVHPSPSSASIVVDAADLGKRIEELAGELHLGPCVRDHVGPVFVQIWADACAEDQPARRRTGVVRAQLHVHASVPALHGGRVDDFADVVRISVAEWEWQGAQHGHGFVVRLGHVRQRAVHVALHV